MSSISPQEVVSHLTTTADVAENNVMSMEQSELSQNDLTAGRSEEKSCAARYDLIIDGTGLVASIVACAASRSGKTILHIDSNDYYGCNSASFPLDDFLTWCRASSSQDEKEKIVDENEKPPIDNAKSKAAHHHSETPHGICDTSDLHILLNPTSSFIRVVQFQDISE